MKCYQLLLLSLLLLLLHFFIFFIYLLLFLFYFHLFLFSSFYLFTFLLFSLLLFFYQRLDLHVTWTINSHCLSIFKIYLHVFNLVTRRPCITHLLLVNCFQCAFKSTLDVFRASKCGIMYIFRWYSIHKPILVTIFISSSIIRLLNKGKWNCHCSIWWQFCY